MTKKKKTVAETKRPSVPEQTNRLIHEKSPYLLSHAHNPVDWHSWGPEAFLRARDEDKPVFLSIGYSTCHWCHVMARESFEDPEVAALLNDTFINIKVDREERPDIDQIYMAAAQMLTGRGGWPLSVVMTPEKRPFFAATYIPKVSRYGMVGLMDLVPRIREVWMNQRDTVVQSAEEITNALEKLSQGRSGTDLEPSVLVDAKNALIGRYDRFNGGFGQAPKFPTPHNLMFLLRYYNRTGEEEVLDVVEKTLLAMRRGGIYDHLGFGFHRYSTDQEWRVPHFEKMLYDNALLAMAYLEAYQTTGRDKWRDTAEEIFAYVLRDMRDSRGGFFSAEDADSEGVEGKFYFWSEDEIRRLLPKEEAELVISFYNVRKEGNFTAEPAGSSPGMNILHVTRSPREFFDEHGLPENETRIRLERARKTLYQAREDRIHPNRDDKILTDWNGLMIAALALGGRVLNNPTYIRAAQKAAAFIARNLFSDDGQLLHRYRAGEAAIPAHLDDYAYLVFGLLELYFATYEPPYLQMARELTAKSIADFWDGESGGFYFTQREGEELLIRSKEIYDGAIPSGNSVFMHNLLRMARLTGDAELEEKGWQISRAFSDMVRESPNASMFLMVALDFAFGPTQEVVLVGERNSVETRIMIDALGKNFLPRTVVFFRPIGEDTAEIIGIAPFTASMSGIEGKATAYVCTGNTCQAPTTEVSGMIRQLVVRSPRI